MASAALAIPLSAVVCLAPLPALADGSIADAALQLRSPLTSAPLGLKLRQYVSLQDPIEGEAPPPTEGTPPPLEGSAPPPPPGAYGPPPPGYYGPPPLQSRPPPRGLGMLISGAVVTGAVGLPLVVYGAYIVAIGREVDREADAGGVVETAGNFVGGFFLVFGILALGAGIPLTIVGGIRLKKYNDWKNGQQQTVRLMPSSGRTAFGTQTVGLRLDF